MIKAPSSGRSLLILGLTAYLLFAVVSLPASLAITWFVPDQIVVSGVSGTAWSGHANAIVLPQLTLADTSWSARPLSLLTAKLSYRITSTISGGPIETIAAFSPNGTIRLRDLSGVVPLGSLLQIAPSVTVNGRIGLDIEQMRIEDHWPTDAQGTVDIVGLNLVSPVAETLGSFEVNFAGAGDAGLEGVISAVDGPLVVNGTLTLGNDKQWNLSGNVKPNASASAQLSQGLAFLGTRNPDGSYTLSYPPR